MKTYKYTIKLVVEVDAWDDSDAWEAVQEHFGIEDQSDLRVIECEYSQTK